ncbi:DUF1453 domain-containing protein [Streptomyces sp. NPDC058045]|uniref:DUF1453 domain-containing protein n=1 Tax=Streptomyces sp. NPDC058045 TaxID=3346311 RepID=UPI0036EFA3B6
MSTLVDVLATVLVVALIVSRQIRPQQLGSEPRWWVGPAVLAALSVHGGGLVDPHHQVVSMALLCAEVAVGIGMGAAWAFTSKLWQDEEGTTWVRGTRATAAAWVLGILLRLGLLGLGLLVGVHQGTGALLLALAVSLLVRKAVLLWRAQLLPEISAAATTYGDRELLLLRKDRL